MDTIQNGLAEGLAEGQPDVYLRSRRKRFILQAVSLFNDILSTLMGAFNAHEIHQLKKQFYYVPEGHNMLVRVTQQHYNDIKSLVMNIRDFAAAIEIMAEYNPAFIVMKIEEQIHRSTKKPCFCANQCNSTTATQVFSGLILCRQHRWT